MHANDDDASYVTQKCATCVDGVLGDSDGGTDDKFDGRRSQRARPTRDEDPGTPPFPTRRGLAPPTPQFVRGGGCDSRSSAPLCLGVHGRGRSRLQSRGCGGAQTVVRVAPGTTAAPVNKATLVVAGGTADIIREEVTVPFPPSRGCLKFPHTRAALKRMSEQYSTDCLEEAAGAWADGGEEWSKMRRERRQARPEHGCPIVGACAGIGVMTGSYVVPPPLLFLEGDPSLRFPDNCLFVSLGRGCAMTSIYTPGPRYE